MTKQQLDFGFDPGAPSTATAKGAKVRKAMPRKTASGLGPSARPGVGVSPEALPTPPPTEARAPSGSEAEAMARELERHPNYRVLRRLVPRLRFDHAAGGTLLTVLVLDTETTGLVAARDKIMELALLRVHVDSHSGLPVGAVEVYDGLQDPGMPIPKEVQQITGITDAMVRGQQLDEARVALMLDGVDLVIAHNAGFDRPFCEARLPQFASLRWACSLVDVNWKALGYGSAKLEQLALQHGWFYDAHRAEVDCHALLAVLGVPLGAQQGNAMQALLAASAQPSYRLQATGAPFEAKDALKARGYRWNAEQKVWHTVLANAELLQAELDWLKAGVYQGRAARVRVEKLDARTKYATRVGEISTPSI